MRTDASIDDRIFHAIERWWAGRYSERHALVTSYDPQKYLAKVAYQPEGTESDWLTIETGHIGNGYGIVIGLQPGQGGMSQGGQPADQSQNQGDQVIVRHQEGDFESGKIVQRVHSQADAPPVCQSGEIIIWTKFQQSGGQTPDSADGGQGGTGQQIALKKDGSLTLTDGNGATIKLDGNGNIVIDCKTLTIVGTADVGVKGGGNVVVKAGANLGIVAGSEAVWQSGGDVNDGSVTAPGTAPSTPPFQTP